jgi:hypothetical protein
MRTLLKDLETLLTAGIMCGAAATGYFEEWAAKDATLGFTRLLHAIMMTLLGMGTLAMGTIVMMVLTVWVSEARRALQLKRKAKLRFSAADLRVTWYDAPVEMKLAA